MHSCATPLLTPRGLVQDCRGRGRTQHSTYFYLGSQVYRYLLGDAGPSVSAWIANSLNHLTLKLPCS